MVEWVGGYDSAIAQPMANICILGCLPRHCKVNIFVQLDLSFNSLVSRPPVLPLHSHCMRTEELRSRIIVNANQRPKRGRPGIKATHLPLSHI